MNPSLPLWAKRALQCTLQWACLALATASQAAPPSSQTLFETLRPSVLEVLNKTRGNQGIASAASGFLVQRQNLVVTNYHAVTKMIFEPAEHELGVVTHDKQRIAAQVIAVDVRHDLALLQLETPMTAPVLTLREQAPAKGETGYAMGKPGHYLHSIVSGTFNGVIEENTAPQQVFSGAINPGMSGGPTLDAYGQVVGINVASSSEDQILGLSVPAEALSALLRRSGHASPPGHAALLKDVAAQFADFGKVQLAQMAQAKQAVRQLGPFQVQGDLAGDKSCRSAHKQHPDRTYRQVQQTCESPSGLYIMSKLYAGHIRTGAFWLQGKHISHYAMSRVVERRLRDFRYVNDDDSPLGPWQCSEQRLRGPADVPIQLHACRSAIEKVPGLSDFRFRYIPLISGQDALIVTVALSGFDNTTAQAVLRRSIAALKTPEEGKK